jgi:hypothetical protein
VTTALSATSQGAAMEQAIRIRPSLRVGLITTLGTNLGDDLIREGILLVLREVLPSTKLHFFAVDKHRPLMVYPRWHPVHLSELADYLPRGRRRVARWIENVFSRLGLSAFDDRDLIIQCGAPVLWPACHACEWAEPLWHHVVGRLTNRLPVLNLAAGSCYPWERQPTRITDSSDAAYLRAILGYCWLTITRDRLAQTLCASLGTQTPMMPCTAFLAGGQPKRSHSRNGMVLINYMVRGGHYDWDQGIDENVWKKTIRGVVARLGKRHPLAFLCHSEVEYHQAQQIDSTLTRLWPKNPAEFFSMVQGARAALCNRLHASVALAGLGIPSVSVGTDTRMLMVEAVGLPYFYVNGASVELLEESLEGLLAREDEERDRLLDLRKGSWYGYCDVVARAIDRV